MIPEVMTINTEADTWTERIHDAVAQIPTEYVITMCEDMFFRKKVRQELIDLSVDRMDVDPDIACFNFEKEYGWFEPSIYCEFGKKPSGAQYRKSCQPTLWRRSILEELLDCKMSAWEWEMSPANEAYKYYIYVGADNNMVFEYGYHNNEWFGIQKGKWVLHDVGPLFEKEGIKIDFSRRGIV